MTNQKKSYRVVGVMSGTSGDGLDLALCHFERANKWSFEIADSVTYPYNTEWKEKLGNAHVLQAYDFVKLHNEFGEYIASQIMRFLSRKKHEVDFISSHGHTVFHQPSEGITCQIGSGARIAATTKITVVSDFRTMDVALGGNGAPLVPLGDEMLFGDYGFCLNLGGFANISFQDNNARKAFDVCPVNIALNHLAKKMGKDYDKDGKFGNCGKIDQPLLVKLNKLKYYELSGPKSLGREWFENQFLPVLESGETPTLDKLRTVYEHIAIQIYKAIEVQSGLNVLITGGGAYNQLAIKLIKKYLPEKKIVVPKNEIIDFKEALIFAFLGVLRLRGECNCLASATGAEKDNIGGTIHRI